MFRVYGFRSHGRCFFKSLEMRSNMREIIFVVWLISLYKYNKIKLQEIKRDDEEGKRNYRDEVEKLVFQNLRALILFYIIVDIAGPYIVALISK